MNFIDNMKKLINEEYNVSITENGAVGYRSSGKALLDINFSVSSLRNKTDLEVITYFAKAYYENKFLAVKWLFFAGDVRGGLGERRLFRLGLLFLSQVDGKLTKSLLPLVFEYTRWDNLLVLLDTDLRDSVCELIKNQLDLDLKNMQNNDSVSLCAKWMPSINATSKTNVRYAKMLAKYMSLTEKNYRKTLSKLRKYIDVVEVKMSDKRWREIDYSKVPSRANLIYSDAFLKNDPSRREKYLQLLENGEAKINAGVLFPHDIVNKYIDRNDNLLAEVDKTLEELWKSLPDYVKGQSNTICVSDGSASMFSRVGNTNITCMAVAVALSIYFSEGSSGQFKDNYVTFSENPQFVDLSSCETLREKIGFALSHNECANTNIEAVFDLILDIAVKFDLKQSDLPSNILILSDMEFDDCVVSANNGCITEKLFNVISEKYERLGYKLPRLVFWNICSSTGTIPLVENELGVALVSGFSPIILNMVLSGRLDPYECLLDQINSKRYDAVEKIIKA